MYSSICNYNIFCCFRCSYRNIFGKKISYQVGPNNDRLFVEYWNLDIYQRNTCLFIKIILIITSPRSCKYQTKDFSLSWCLSLPSDKVNTKKGYLGEFPSSHYELKKEKESQKSCIHTCECSAHNNAISFL